MSRRTTRIPRVSLAGRAMGLLFLAAAISQARLHTFERDSTLDLAEDTNRFTTRISDKARRGVIYDRKGKPLATEEPAFELIVEFEKTPKSDAFLVELSDATGVPADEFLEAAASGEKTRVWRENFGPGENEALEALRRRWRCSGVSLRSLGRRAYPLGSDASCILGFVREREPLMGLELSQEDLLSGQDGVRAGLTDRSGNFLPMRLKQETTTKIDGQSVVLTIDSDLQSQAASAIRKAVEDNKADDGVAIIMDPKTGDILAMANWPSFSPYRPDGSDGDMSKNTGYNPAYMGVLEPGSTFKILTLAKAIDAGKTTVERQINCSGQLNYNASWRIRCDLHHGSRAHGSVDGVKAIAKSCNVSAATWALEVGREDFIKYVEDLGMLRKSRLGLPNEVSGQFNYDEYARPLQLMTVGFGQSISTTPVGLVGAFGMLANNGIRMEPRLIKGIGGKTLTPEPGTPVIRPETAAEVMECMEAVIESDIGTGKTLRIPGYRLAGKTGTAQKIGGGKGGYVSNFVGYVPSRDPKAVLLVMVNNPKNGSYYGATVAGPVFHTLSKAVIRHFKLPPTERH